MKDELFKESVRRRVNRRSVIAGMSAGALAAGVARPALSQQRSLTINSFGGPYEVSHRKSIIEPFEKRYNVRVNVVTVYSADILAQMRAQKAAPQFDVAHFSGFQEAIAAREGLLHKITPADLPETGKSLYPFVLAGMERGEGPIMTIAAVGLLYNMDKVKPVPASWKALLDPKFKGHLVLTDFSNSYGLLAALMLNQTLGGTIDNMDPGFEALRSIAKDATVIWRTPDIQFNFVQNDAWLAPFGQDYAFALRKAGTPVRFVMPNEGAAASFVTANVVANRPNIDLAMKFIDFSLRVEAQELWAKDWRYSPVNRDVKLDTDTAADVIYGEAAMSKLTIFDPIKLNEKRQGWMDQWSRLIAK